VNSLDVIAEPARVAAAQSALPVDGPRARILDRLVSLAAELIEAPIAMLTIVEGHRQVFAAHAGLPEHLAAAGSSPLEYSICQHAVATGLPFIVDDASQHPVLRDNRAVLDLGVAAYAGIPLILDDRFAIGTFCVADVVVRDWSDDQLAQLTLLADIATDQFELQRHERAAAFRRGWAGVFESDWRSPQRSGV
jgi:GAF domain-containing protein